jgi:hypothetical protein
MIKRLLCTKRSRGIELPAVEARERRDAGVLIGRRDSQMINQSQKGMRCRTTKLIRTHGGLISRFTEGTIQGVIDNLGRQLISVEWDSGVTTYVFFNEIEIKTRVESEVGFF